MSTLTAHGRAFAEAVARFGPGAGLAAGAILARVLTRANGAAPHVRVVGRGASRGRRPRGRTSPP